MHGAAHKPACLHVRFEVGLVLKCYLEAMLMVCACVCAWYHSLLLSSGVDDEPHPRKLPGGGKGGHRHLMDEEQGGCGVGGAAWCVCPDLILLEQGDVCSSRKEGAA